MRTLAAALLSALCFAACSAGTAQFPVADAAGALAANPDAGIYVAQTRSRDALPNALIVLQVGPAGQCPGFADISLTGKRPPQGRTSYAAPLAVTTFRSNGDGVAVAASSTLGEPLGKLRLHGEIKNSEFDVQYADALGKGAATARFVARCGGLRSGNPPDAAFIGTWDLHLGASVAGTHVAETDLSLVISGVSPGTNGSLLLNGTLSTNTPVTPNPPYRVGGSFKDGMLTLYAATSPETLGFAASLNAPFTSSSDGEYVLGKSTFGRLGISKKKS